jgi:hypothetical protein
MLYNSVNARISRLCDAMGIGPDLKQRIWTLFEYAVSTDVCDTAAGREVKLRCL